MLAYPGDEGPDLLVLVEAFEVAAVAALSRSEEPVAIKGDLFGYL
jgi:hypothetical protein